MNIHRIKYEYYTKSNKKVIVTHHVDIDTGNIIINPPDDVYPILDVFCTKVNQDCFNLLFDLSGENCIASLDEVCLSEVE